MPPASLSQIEAHEIHHGKGARGTPVVGRSLEHHTCGSTIYLGSTAIFWENTLEEGQGPPTSHLQSPTS
ncbi:hypothetical protein TNCV_2340011 [Trichonephila clavipes]|nr:hypothetical protein TNCV_2340011 [Trichonephila clavipes]